MSEISTLHRAFTRRTFTEGQPEFFCWISWDDDEHWMEVSRLPETPEEKQYLWEQHQERLKRIMPMTATKRYLLMTSDVKWETRSDGAEVGTPDVQFLEPL